MEVDLFHCDFVSHLSLLSSGLDRMQNTKGIEMHMNKQQENIFCFTHKRKQCAWSRLVQHKTKLRCTHLFRFITLYNQLVLFASTFVFPFLAYFKPFQSQPVYQYVNSPYIIHTK